MDFFLRNFEAAQQQARSLTLSASQSAKGFAEQISEQTKTFAEQAATASSAAAEQASQRWKGLNLQEALQLRALQQQRASAVGLSSQELEQYAISPEFQDYIRSLTYSTFRDFPLEKLPEVKKESGEKALTPWQEKHALLVVQEVKEINELRFVLCPKRMTDTQFWQVYFTLAKKYLPPEAFDPRYTIPEAAETQSKMTELQSGIRRTFDSARETALDWSSRASGSLRPAETSAQLHDLVESRSRGNTPTAGPEAVNAASPSTRMPFAGGLPLGGRPPTGPEDLDNELEAYLQTIAKDSEGTDAVEGRAASESEEAEDLDQYLSELTTGDDNRREEEGSEEAVDLEEYMQNLRDDDAKERETA